MSTDPSPDRWQRLRQGGHESAGLEIPTLDTRVETGFGSIRWALGAGGEPRLLLPIRQGESVQDLEVSDALTLSIATYHLQGSPVRFIDLCCHTPALEPVFGEVADEIIRRVRSGEGTQPACRTTLDDFRALLASNATEVASEKICGLLGELLVLRQLLELHPDAWLLWRGPLMERHDFRGDALAIEVKSSTRVSNRSVRISAIDQLQEPSEGELLLCLCLLDAASGGDLSISSVALEVIERSSDPLKVRQLLAAVGCSDPNAPGWNRLHFRLEGQIFYEVKGAFPRIVPQTLAGGEVPPGIGDVNYSLDLGSASEFELASDHVQSWLEKLIKCLP